MKLQRAGWNANKLFSESLDSDSNQGCMGGGGKWIDFAPSRLLGTS